MDKNSRSKLQELFKLWPPQAVGTTAWLLSKGYSHSLLERYVSSGWIEALGRGAYQRADLPATWQGAVWALQQQLNLAVHVGGKTALAVRGAIHYLPLSRSTVYLIGSSRVRLPKWFTEYEWKDNVYYRTSSMFSAADRLGLEKAAVDGFELVTSSPERAMFEVLEQVPYEQDIDECFELMDYQATARIKLVQGLLNTCNSVKVNRLFLVLAERSGHSWANRLKLQNVNLGAGVRHIIKGGTLNQKYLITLPVKQQAPKI